MVLFLLRKVTSMQLCINEWLEYRLISYANLFSEYYWKDFRFIHQDLESVEKWAVRLSTLSKIDVFKVSRIFPGNPGIFPEIWYQSYTLISSLNVWILILAKYIYKFKKYLFSVFLVLWPKSRKLCFWHFLAWNFFDAFKFRRFRGRRFQGLGVLLDVILTWHSCKI